MRMATLEERLRSRLTSAVQTVTREVSTNTFSGYLVKRLIVQGSFRNVYDGDTAKGFQVQVKNKIGVATIVGCTPVTVDGEVFTPEQIMVRKGANEFRASEISDRLPVNTAFGDEMSIVIEDDQGLEAGKHDIELGLNMAGIGIVRVKFDETLKGRACEKRSRKAPPTAEGEADLDAILRRTVELASASIGADTIARCAKTLDGIVLDLGDRGSWGLALSSQGTVEIVPAPPPGKNVLTIKTTHAVFHNMAHNKINAGIAYARGEVRLEGVPVLKLRGMDPLITSIFQGYRAASEGVEFEDTAAPAGGRIIEEMLGMGLTALDEVLKVLDKVLGRLGVSYFYEKSMNRLEMVWDILDREIRKMLAFGREDEGDAGEPEADAPEVAKKKPAKKEAPAPVSALREKLRKRITETVESAVGEITRSAVSSYLVKRLIKPGSFRNFEEDGEVAGFEVKLLNKLGTATVIGFSDIKIDGETYTTDQIEIVKLRRSIPAAEISESKPLLVSFGDELHVRVRKPGGLAPGKHRLVMGVSMVGMGGVDVDYEEKLSA